MLSQRQKVLSLFSYVLCIIVVVLIYSVATSKCFSGRLSCLAKPSSSSSNSASIDSSLCIETFICSLHSLNAEI